MTRESQETFFITGGAGFIGSNLADRLLSAGHRVIVYDNFSTGQRPFIENASKHPDFKLIEGDVLDSAALSTALEGVDFVFHLAANADIRGGLDNPRKDLEQNTIATFTLLEAMREKGVSRIAFASSAAALGEPSIFPTVLLTRRWKCSREPGPWILSFSRTVGLSSRFSAPPRFVCGERDFPEPPWSTP